MNLRDIKIRRYKKGDFEEIKNLWIEAHMYSIERGDDENVIKNTFKYGAELFLMVHDKEIIGTSWVTCDGRRLLLHHFAVKKEFRGKGLSKILLKYTLDYANGMNMQIKLEVHSRNYTAVNLYEKFGFNKIDGYDIYVIRDFKQ